MIVSFVDRMDWYGQLIRIRAPKRVLAVAWFLANRIDCREDSDRYGWAYPTVEQITEETGDSKQRVSEFTSELAKYGWIVKTSEKTSLGRKTFYQLAVGVSWDIEPCKVAEKSISNLRQGPKKRSEKHQELLDNAIGAATENVELPGVPRLQPEIKIASTPVYTVNRSYADKQREAELEW